MQERDNFLTSFWNGTRGIRRSADIARLLNSSQLQKSLDLTNSPGLLKSRHDAKSRHSNVKFHFGHKILYLKPRLYVKSRFVTSSLFRILPWMSKKEPQVKGRQILGYGELCTVDTECVTRKHETNLTLRERLFPVWKVLDAAEREKSSVQWSVSCGWTYSLSLSLFLCLWYGMWNAAHCTYIRTYIHTNVRNPQQEEE